VSVPVSGSLTRENIRSAFEDAYKAAYGRLLQNIQIRVLNLRLAVIGKRPKFDLTLLAPGPDCTVEAARTGAREVWFDGAYRTTELYDRLQLPVGARIPGPAILEQADTTILIEPGMQGEVDRFGSIVITREEAAK
jgi:N-methylhydantoinase A